MHIILTGERGIGKTATAWVVAQGLKALGFTVSGFVTEKFSEGLLLRNVAGGEPIAMAYTSAPDQGVACTRVGRYFFLDSALRLAHHMLRWPSDVVLIDELGRLEALGGGLTHAIDLINGLQFKHSITVVRKSVLPHLIGQYRREPMIIEITRDNQELVSQAIFDRFRHFDGAQIRRLS